MTPEDYSPAPMIEQRFWRGDRDWLVRTASDSEATDGEFEWCVQWATADERAQIRALLADSIAEDQRKLERIREQIEEARNDGLLRRTRVARRIFALLDHLRDVDRALEDPAHPDYERLLREREATIEHWQRGLRALEEFPDFDEET
jgi:hypothetical protein